MKIAAAIARILLGLIFLGVGVIGFLPISSHGPMPSGLAGQFLAVLSQSHYDYFVSAVQAVRGALLLVNRYVPFGLTLLGPVIANILAYRLLMDLKGIPLAIVVTILWGILAFRNRRYFAGLLVQRTA